MKWMSAWTSKDGHSSALCLKIYAISVLTGDKELRSLSATSLFLQVQNAYHWFSLHYKKKNPLDNFGALQGVWTVWVWAYMHACIHMRCMCVNSLWVISFCFAVFSHSQTFFKWFQILRIIYKNAKLSKIRSSANVNSSRGFMRCVYGQKFKKGAKLSCIWCSTQKYSSRSRCWAWGVVRNPFVRQYYVWITKPAYRVQARVPLDWTSRYMK